MDCIFCRIANGEIPSATVYEDDLVRVILDLGPAAKGHMRFCGRGGSPRSVFCSFCIS